MIAEEIISHLLVKGARVKITLEIEADLPAALSDHTVRTVSENSRTLKFDDYGFSEQ